MKGVNPEFWVRVSGQPLTCWVTSCKSLNLVGAQVPLRSLLALTFCLLGGHGPDPIPGPSTSQFHFAAVAAQVVGISGGCVALVNASILGLQAGNLEHHGITLQTLHLYLTSCHSGPKDSIGESGIPGTDNAQGSLWGLRPVQEPLEVLLSRALVASDIAGDGDGCASHTIQGPLRD